MEAGAFGGGNNMTLVFLLEERSTERLLNVLLPKILPAEVSYITIPHEGKSDLQKSLSHKLVGWNVPDTKFVVIQDQDSNDCIELKKVLEEVCLKSGKDVLIRIACHEMEAWYFGDMKAVSKAYGKDFTKYSRKSRFRNPDNIVNPKKELKKMIPEHEQLAGAERIGPHMDIENNTSHSFNVLIDGIRKMLS